VPPVQVIEHYVFTTFLWSKQDVRYRKQFARRGLCALQWRHTVNNGSLSMTSIDQQFVEFIVKSLVSKPEAVTIERRIDEKGVLLELTVDPEDLGRVIGKRGATAQSVRTLLRALGTKNDARYNLKIVDVDRPGGVGDDAAVAAPVAVAATDDSQTTSLADDQPVDNSTDTPVEEQESKASRTRKELADLDDLDI
jgi:predicted RNA-binding protein YlqC (UPF0109 family)